MNWGQLDPRFYGLLLFLLFLAAAFAVGLLGVLWTLYQFNKARTADLDLRIQAKATACVKAEIAPVEARFQPIELQLQRIQQDTEFAHRETMTLLSELEKRLPKAEAVASHDSRIGRLESRSSDQAEEIEDLFRRMRKLEIAHAREHGATTDDETELATTEPIPPRAR